MDCVLVDTAAMTGEPIPRKIPSEEYGNELLGGQPIVNGECYARVDSIGTNTKLGEIFMDLQVKKAKGADKSDFEQQIIKALRVIIAVSCVVSLFVFVIQAFQRDQ